MGLAWQQGPLASGAIGRLEPGRAVVPHGVDRDLTTDEVATGRQG